MRINRFLTALGLSLVSIAASAAPVGERLLALVPQDAQIVSALKVTKEAEAQAQPPLVTHANNVDFNDWLAMVSVDPQLCGRELVEVASSSPRGDLKERLLLVDGSFDAKHIYRSALQGAASAAEYAGVRVIIVQPFAREDAWVGVRWLAIPDDRTALFGTPLLVQRALQRRDAGTQTDPALAARLKDLQPGADDWSVLVMPSSVFERHLGETFYAAEAIQALTHSDDMAMGFRYRRSTLSIDFVAQAERGFPVTAMSLGGQAELMRARFTGSSRVHLERIAVEKGRIVGTLTITEPKKNDNPREWVNRRASAAFR